MPEFYPGILGFLLEFQRRGGKVVVMGHSEVDVIKYHYQQVGQGFMPDGIFGWDDDARRRKPSVWPAQQALHLMGLSAADVLVVDDLSPGVLMARAAGLQVLAAGWGHRIPAIQAYMRSECDFYAETVEELGEILFQSSLEVDNTRNHTTS